MEALGRRFATPTEFRRAVRLIVSDKVGRVIYTDKSRGKNKNKRYVAMQCNVSLTDKEVHDIEVVLWMVGATANTRQEYRYLRGTCEV
jgi:predicted dehydrogenase